MPKITNARVPGLAALVALLALAAAMALPAGASAATLADCQTTIQTLADQTQTVTITGQNADKKDSVGLLGKLDDASAKLGVGKTADAIQKLEDYKAKIQQLQAAGKLSAEGAAPLLAGADDAIACIQSTTTA